MSAWAPHWYELSYSVRQCAYAYATLVHPGMCNNWLVWLIHRNVMSDSHCGRDNAGATAHVHDLVCD